MAGTVTVSIKTMESLIGELAKKKGPAKKQTGQKKTKKSGKKGKSSSPKAKKEKSKSKVRAGGVTKKKRAPKTPGAGRKKKPSGTIFTPAQVATLVQTMPQTATSAAGLSSPTK
jgi:hypothetical protein